MRFLVAILSLAVATPAVAVDYACPTDPGFCYLDVGNDGCFDAGTDESPIEGLLGTGVPYPGIGQPGSIVCPPSVGRLRLDTVAWQTAAGGDVLLHGARLDVADGIAIDSGNRIHLGGAVKASNGDVEVDAAGDLSVAAHVRVSRGSARLEAFPGDLLVQGSGQRVQAHAVRLSGADTELSDGIRLDATQGGVQVVAGATGDVTMGSARLLGNSVFVEAANVHASGKLIVEAETGDVLFRAPGGELRVSQIVAIGNVTSEFAFEADHVVIGGVGANGKVSRSTVRGDVGSLGPQSSLVVQATGPIEIENLTTRRLGDVVLETTGTQIDLLESRLRGTPLPAMPLSLSAGPGSTCDLTGSRLDGVQTTTSCDTVVGP